MIRGEIIKIVHRKESVTRRESIIVTAKFEESIQSVEAGRFSSSGLVFFYSWKDVATQMRYLKRHYRRQIRSLEREISEVETSLETPQEATA